MAEPILTVAAAARAVGISPATLRRMIDQGLVAYVEVGGVKRVRLSAVRAAIVECLV